MKFNIFIILLFSNAILMAQKQDSCKLFEQDWGKKFSTTKEIIDIYQHYQHLFTPQDSVSRITHDCFMVLQSGEYIIQTKGTPQDLPLLLDQIPSIIIDHPVVINFLQKHDPEKFSNYYYMIQALKQGDTFEESRDGISISTQFSMRPLNHNDYSKLKNIFSSNNKLLQNLYLEKMKFLFQTHGYTEEMATLYPIIKSNLTDSPLKQEILDLYAQYTPLRKGQPAPLVIFKDSTDTKYTFSDFKGKIIVVDIWATWCCSCIEKIPKFLELQKDFQYNKDIIFLTISIDPKNARSKWLKTIEQNNMTGLLNLIPENEKGLHFETTYHVVGVPRYFIIDQEGKIVTVFAPGPGKRMKELIQTLLK